MTPSGKYPSARSEGIRSIAEAQRALREARAAGDGGIAAAQRALAQAQADAVRSEREAQRQVAEAHRTSAREIKDAQRGVGEAVRARTEQMAQAQRQLTQTHLETARQIKDAQEGVVDSQREGARQVADAQRQVAEAQRAAAQAAKAAAAAQKDLKDETVKLTPAQKALYDEYKRFEKLADRAFRPAQNAAAKLGLNVLDLAENYLPSLGTASRATVDALSRAFGTFREELARPIVQSGITAYLKVIPRFTEVGWQPQSGKLGIASLQRLFPVAEVCNAPCAWRGRPCRPVLALYRIGEGRGVR